MKNFEYFNTLEFKISDSFAIKTKIGVSPMIHSKYDI